MQTIDLRLSTMSRFTIRHHFPTRSRPPFPPALRPDSCARDHREVSAAMKPAAETVAMDDEEQSGGTREARGIFVEEVWSRQPPGTCSWAQSESMRLTVRCLLTKVRECLMPWLIRSVASTASSLSAS